MNQAELEANVHTTDAKRGKMRAGKSRLGLVFIG